MALPVAPSIALPPRARGRRLGNWKLTVGLALCGGLLVLSLVAPIFASRTGLRLGANLLGQPPSVAYPLGTDTTGRDIATLLIFGTPTTLWIGLIAGTVGTAVGVVLGLVSGYFRGAVDSLIRVAADVMLGIPALAVQIVIAAVFGVTSLWVMALIIALFAWPFPTRALRAQTLSMREQGFVQISKLSGRNDAEVIFLEMLPNLLPLIMATFVGAVSGSILISFGLQLLGLGQFDTLTLGVMLATALQSGAVLRGMWWWWGPPTVVLVLLFVGLFLISMALDEVANPRLRQGGR